jgi:hypothetical protein
MNIVFQLFVRDLHSNTSYITVWEVRDSPVTEASVFTVWWCYVEFHGVCGQELK